MNEEDTVVRETAISRKGLVELIILVILLSFGINLIADQLFNWLQEKSFIILLLGTIFCLTPIAYAFVVLFRTRKKQLRIEGCLAYNPIKKELVPIERYAFSETICEYIQAAFAENPALKTRWERQPLEPYQIMVLTEDGQKEKVDHGLLSKLRIPIDGTTEAFLPSDMDFSMHFHPISVDENDTVRLITEAMECFLLEQLSIQLESHFNNEQFNKKYLTVYERRDIPDMLLTNTFLELFSRPMTERVAFVDTTFENRETGKETTESISYEFGGSRYRRFRLILPKGSRLKRLTPNTIEIQTKKVRIALTTQFNGKLGGLGFAFRNYYMGTTNLFDLATYAASIEVHISIKLRTLLSGAGWNYYHWINSFLKDIEQEVSLDAFLTRINWESNLALLTCLKHMPNAPHIHQDAGNSGGMPTQMVLKMDDHTKKQ